jgi:predicted TIM-barrel fold metal-dependent hydrolase
MSAKARNRMGYLRQRDVTMAPSFAVPSGACDCHAHVIGDPAQYPFAPNRSFTPVEASHQEYLSVLYTLGIERMVVVQPSFYGFDNSCTLAAVAASGLHRARGIAMIDPAIDRTTLRALDAGGIRGARFITIAKGGGSLGQLRDVARLVAPLGWHVQMYVGADVWREMADTILALPVQVVIDHMGQITADKDENDPNFKAILRMLDSGRCWVKICGYRNSVSGHPYADVAPLAKRFIAHAPERCVWGTDWPHTNMKSYVPDDGALLDLLRDWAPDEAARHRILVTNPAALYGFPDAGCP